MKKETTLIVGDCIAGISCAETLRQYGYDGNIIMLSKEEYPAYGRPLISYYLAGKISFDNIFLRDEDFYEKMNIEHHLNTKVVSIDFDNCKVNTEKGKVFSYDKLVIAAGGNPFIPPIKGSENVSGVTTFTTLKDALYIEEHLDSIEKVVVLGAGLIGLKATEALSYRGKDITMVELANRVLPTVLDVEGGNYFYERMKKDGIKFFFENTVEEVISENGKIRGVRLKSGDELICDLLIIAIGVRPNLDFIDKSKLDCGRGIKINKNSKTNVDNVYAAGDIADAYDLIFNTVRNMPIWPNAYWQGRFAALDIVGKEYDFSGHIVMNSIAYKDLPMISAGIIEAPNVEIESKIIKTEKTYRRFNFQEDKLVGMLFIGDVQDKGVLIHLMNHQDLVPKLKDRIFKEDFSFIDFPEDYREEHLKAAYKKI